jgi:hypothetical protein
MGTASCVQNPAASTFTRGPWSVTVPWDKADNLRSRLARRGLLTTVCLDPEARIARLEPWPGTDPDRVLAELAPTEIVSAA